MSRDLLDVEVERRGGAVRVALKGELDISTVDAVRDKLDDLLGGPRIGHVLIDLRELAYMDSTGIRLLLEVDAGARRDGFDLAVVKGPAAVHRVLELTQVDERLPLVDRPGEPWSDEVSAASG